METKLEALPEHVLELVIDRLSLPDVIRLGCACKAMKSICGPLQFPNHLPWLIVPTTMSTVFGDQEEVGFFSLCDGKVYKAKIPQVWDRRICGSFPGGWLMTVHHNSEIQLFNPFSSKAVIPLPPLNTFPGVDETIRQEEEGEGVYFYSGIEYPGCTFRMESKYMRDSYIHKVAISSSSISKGTVVMTIRGIEKTLAFYTVGGENRWSPATPPNQRMSMRFFQDLTYYRGSFYAVNENGQVVVVVVQPTSTTLYAVAHPIISLPPSSGLDGDNYYYQKELYILESSGDLLVVIRSIFQEKRCGPHKTIGFRVFKLNNQWEEVRTLANRSLFLGFNQSYSLSALDFSGCKPNSIYFTDTTDAHHCLGFGGHDFGIFTLEDATVHKFLYPTDTILVTPPPFWFTPFPSSTSHST